MSASTPPSPEQAAERAGRATLLDALLGRRSRRFGRGMRMPGGPLAYASAQAPAPLTSDEEALLAFAACGLTGYALGDLPYDSGGEHEAGGGNIMMHFVGRTVPSGDGAHTATVFVINDEGVWMLPRPQDVPRQSVAAMLAAARAGQFAELYGASRIRIAERRIDVAREIPATAAFNKWAANRPGATVFLPVAELSALALNVILSAFSEEYGYYVLDDRNGFRPAGVAAFARSRGGHLYDDPAAGRTATISVAESWLYEFAAIEQGAILQNLGLMAQALGLGGFAFFAAHPYAWTQALGFTMLDLPLSRVLGLGPLARTALRVLGRDAAATTALGLERDGATLIKPFCPPYYPSMREAVLAFVEYKCAPGSGTQHDGGAATGWRDGALIQSAIPRYSDRTVDATIAYCEYVYRRYGRFPPGHGPMRTVLAYQAQRVDDEFYRRFYRADALAGHPGAAERPDSSAF
jgi:hypothetical protein